MRPLPLGRNNLESWDPLALFSVISTLDTSGVLRHLQTKIPTGSTAERMEGKRQGENWEGQESGRRLGIRKEEINKNS